MSLLHPIRRLRQVAALNIPLDLDNMPAHYRHVVRRGPAHLQIRAAELIAQARKDKR